MSDLNVIESALQRTARRRRLERALRGLWIGVLVGAILSLLLDGAYHVWPLPLWSLPATALIALPCMLAGFIIGGWRKPALAQTARWVDGRQHLKERLSTALEVASKPASGRWADLVVADAAGHATSIDTRQMVPLNL